MQDVQLTVGEPLISEVTATGTVMLVFPFDKKPCKDWQKYFREEVKKLGMVCEHPVLNKDTIEWEVTEQQANMAVIRDSMKKLIEAVNDLTAVKAMVDSSKTLCAR